MPGMVGVSFAMTRPRTIRLVVLFLVVAGTAGCDQATKQIARTQLSQVGSITLPGSFFQLTLAENPGAFLSLGASLPQMVRSALAVGLGMGLVCLLVYLVRTTQLRFVSFLGGVLIWAGGISNLADRFSRHGLVTDFMVIRVGPVHTGVFNVADLAIVIGLLILVVSLPVGARKGEADRTENGANR
jgi:signal peptidase II